MEREIIEAIHNCVTGYSLIAIGLLIAFIIAIGMLYNPVKRMSATKRIAFVFFALAACISMAVKPSTPFKWDTGLMDNGSTVEGNSVVLKWTYNMTVPAGAEILVFYRGDGETTWQEHEMESVYVSDGTVSFSLEGAEGKTFWIIASYEPPAPVHTNGVWVGKAYKTRSDNGFIVIKSTVTENGKIIATPEKKETR